MPRVHLSDRSLAIWSASKIVHHRKILSFRARTNFTLAVNL